jgi:precorrin-6B methylase 2
MSKFEATFVSVLVQTTYSVIRNPSEVIKTKQQAAAAIRVDGGGTGAELLRLLLRMMMMMMMMVMDAIARPNKSTTTTTTTSWQAFRTEFEQYGIAGFYDIGKTFICYPAGCYQFASTNQLWSSTTATAMTGYDSNDSTMMFEE